MVIAIDLDGVVFDSEEYYRTYAHLYDINLVKNGLLDKKEMNHANVEVLCQFEF